MANKLFIFNDNVEEIIEALTEDLTYIKYDSDYENYDTARKEIQIPLNNNKLL